MSIKQLPNFLRDSLGDWYEEYHKLIHHDIKERLSKCTKEDVEDLTSEVFRRAARRLANGGDPIVNPKKWLSAIADSVCTDYGRDNAGKPIVVSAEYVTSEGEKRSHFDDLECSDDDQPEIAAETHALCEKAQQYLNELPPDWREAIALYYFKGWSLKRIAHKMRKSVSTVRNYIHKGLEYLRRRMLRDAS